MEMRDDVGEASLDGWGVNWNAWERGRDSTGSWGGDGVTRLYLGRHSASSAVGLRRVECPIPRANF
jgi:hypothetical protein